MNSVRSVLTGTLAVAAVVAGSATATTLTPAAAAPAGTPTCGAVPDGATFIATSASGATVDQAASSEPLTLPLVATPQITMRGPDGTIWAQALAEGTAELHRVGTDGSSELIASGEVSLKSVGWLDGRSAAAVVDYSPDSVRPGDADSSGAVWVEYADGSPPVDFGPSQGPEYGVGDANIGAGRLVEGGASDLAEWFAFYDASVQELTDWFDPTDAAPYNAPPLYQAPVAASDAESATLSWIEGPDWDGATNEVVGGWSLVVADAITGAESLRLDLGTPGARLLHADFDGRFWVGTFGDEAGDQTESPPPARVVVVDTQAPTPAPIDPGCPAGVTVTLDRAGTPQPPPSTPPDPTTTVAPPPEPPATTAAPSPTCPTYTENPQRYPVQLCEKGETVRNVQIRLAQLGHAIETDGYFGPATQQAVRDFQEGAGLDVDGLVGPDTWAALAPEGGFFGVDTDGSGVLDPWEIYYDDANESDQWKRYIGLVYTSPPTDFAIVDQATGAAIPGVASGQSTLVNCCDNPAWVVEHIVADGQNQLWLSRSDGHNPDGTALPWTVHDAVGFFPLSGDMLLMLCTLDGVSNDSVVGVVRAPQGGIGPFTNVTVAWVADIASGSLVDVDPARVTCSLEGD